MIRKHSISRHHFQAARYFAEQAKQIEAQGVKAGLDESGQMRHRAYVVGSVVTSAAALEASINELFLEACDRNTTSLAGIDPAAVSVLAEVWSQVERFEILTKYQTALLLCRKQAFEKGRAPFQDAAALVALRNALVHHKPEWENEADVHVALQKRLHGNFEENVLVSTTSLWFPHRCLGRGCAAWVIDSAVSFSKEFCSRMGIPARHG